MCAVGCADNDLITIADDSDFAHAREYAQRGVVKMVVYGKLGENPLCMLYINPCFGFELYNSCRERERESTLNLED